MKIEKKTFIISLEMKRIRINLICFLIFLSFSFSGYAQIYNTELTESEQVWLKTHPNIKMVGDPDWLPFEAFDDTGKYIGIVSEFIQLIEKQLKIHIEIIPTKTWSESVELVKSGKVDLISETDESDLQEILHFSKSYLSNPVVIVMGNKENYVESIDKIKNKKIAMIINYGYVSKIRNKYPNLDYLFVNNIEEGLLAVSEGRSDAMLCTIAEGSYAISRNGLHNIKIVGKTEFQTNLAFGIRQDYEPLVTMINKCINNISENEKSTILDKWAPAKYVEKTDYSLVFKIGGLLLFILTIIFYWNRLLEKKVELRTKELEQSRQNLLTKNAELQKAKQKAEENKILIQKQYNDLQASEEKRLIVYNQLQNIMNSSTLVAIIATDIEGIITHFNSGAQLMLGYSEAEIVGKQSPVIIHLQEEIEQYSESIYKDYGVRVRGFDVFKYEILQGKKYLEKEWRYVRKDGTQFIVNLAVTSVRNSMNDVVGFLGIALDISRQKMAEKALLDYKENLEECVKNRTADLGAANEKLQVTNEELHEKNEIIHEQNEELKSTLQNLKDTQTQLFQSEKMASIGILTAGVAHEINNPLNFINGAYLGLLHFYDNSSFCENHQQVGELLNALEIGINRASAIVSGLNQFSRNSKSLNEDCNLNAIINNCLIMLNNQTKNRITVKKYFYSDEIVIKGNVGDLHQVFLNVLSNAIQAIEYEGEIYIMTIYSFSNIIVEISDTGVGISAENLSKVSDPFYTTKDPGKGTGLGLSISYNIIKEHQGNIEFESTLGKGTTVKITLPKKN